MKPRHAVSLVVLTLAASARAEAPQRELPQLFPTRAEVQITKPGLQSLALPVEVVRACRPGLSDVRLWSDGREIPYLVDTTGPDAWTLAETLEPHAGKVRQDGKAPLCDAPQVGTHCVSIELEAPKTGTGWELVFELPDARFVERVQLAVRKGDRPEPLVRDESIYRLPGPGERVRLPLPAAALGTVLTVVLQGDGAAVSPKLRWERGTTVRGTESLETPLAVASEWRGKDGTHVVLDRPLGLLPTALRLETKTGAFSRAVRVYDTGGGDDHHLLGEGRVIRLVQQVAGGKVAIDQIELPMATPHLRRLELVMDDGDSPKLEGLVVRAVVRRPVLVFDREGAGAVELFYGGGRVEAPRYDLQALLPASIEIEGAEGARAEIAARLRARDGISRAELGPSAPNPRFDASPALAAVMHAGGAIDLAVYGAARPLHVPTSPDGLTRYLLAADDLAAARVDLADLRVVDGSGRQWPYLVDRDVAPVVVALTRPKATTRDGKTRYEITLPVSPLAARRLELDTTETFFDRPYALLVRDEAGREHRIEGRMRRELSERGATRLAIDGPRMTALVLEVHDGGDAPLGIVGARLEVPTVAIELVAQPGDYRLLAGDVEAEAPSYELRTLEALIAQLDASPIRADALGANPDFSRSARLKAGGMRERLIVWVVLGLAVLVLGALTLRMARAERGA